MISKTFRIDTGYGKTIVMRPRSEDDSYPNHKLVRIVIDGTVHSVQGHDLHLVQALSLVAVTPEERWNGCPHCGKNNWSAWMPSAVYETWTFRGGSMDGHTDHERQLTRWYVLCINCGRLVEMNECPPYNTEITKELVYDPTDDRPLWEPPKERTASKPSRRTRK